MFCLTSVKFNMTAEVWRQDQTPPNPEEPGGHYEDAQDPLTGEIIRVWVPGVVDNPDTPEDEQQDTRIIPCSFRAVIGNGLRSAGTTEEWGEQYANYDFARMNFSSSIKLSQRDRITNVRDSQGNIAWLEEAYGDGTRATVFNVLGVAPIVDPFGRHTENQAFLERASVQGSDPDA